MSLLKDSFLSYRVSRPVSRRLTCLVNDFVRFCVESLQQTGLHPWRLYKTITAVRAGSKLSYCYECYIAFTEQIIKHGLAGDPTARSSRFLNDIHVPNTPNQIWTWLMPSGPEYSVLSLSLGLARPHPLSDVSKTECGRSIDHAESGILSQKPEKFIKAH